jgi:hypothetical protein
MSFGRNPHVAKAEAAELKARGADDQTARTMAWREAARQWDRAAERENHDKRRSEYQARAETARANADAQDAGTAPEPESAPTHEPRNERSRLLN